MAANKKPTALRELQGTANRNKHRDNQDQPVITRGIGPAPKHLNDDQKKIWDEIVSGMYAGVLGEADRLALETLTRLVYVMRRDFEKMSAAKLSQLSTMLGKFGMTPSDRTKIVVPKGGEKKNGFTEMNRLK
jgi:phage terminase small subunit